jgi:hypothetical protein
MKKSKALTVRTKKASPVDIIAKEASPTNIIKEEKFEVKLNGKILTRNKDYIMNKDGEIVLNNRLQDKINNERNFSLSSYYFKSICKK